MTEPHPRPPQVWKVEESSKGQRLDVFLRDRLKASRAKVSEILLAKRVRVNGRLARKGQSLETSQVVQVDWHEEAKGVLPEPIAPLTILYSDATLVFLDKRAGIPSHPLRPLEKGTVANALVARFPECASASQDWREAGLCHRLDIETSGVLLAARDSETWRRVREAFGERTVRKRYLALVTGPIADSGEIDLPLRHSLGHRVVPSVKGREAYSAFRVLSRSDEYALVEVDIRTGVLHQVRAHLAAIGAPVVGDALYGGRKEGDLGRFFLHASSLELVPPLRSPPLKVQSPLPKELSEVLARHGMQEWAC